MAQTASYALPKLQISTSIAFGLSHVDVAASRQVEEVQRRGSDRDERLRAAEAKADQLQRHITDLNTMQGQLQLEMEEAQRDR